MSPHWIIAPIVLPLAAGALMLLLDERRQRRLRAAINLASTLALVAIAVALLRWADAPAPDGGAATGVYLLANWPAPFGIVLVADRLSALMLLLTALLGLTALVYSLAGWHRAGTHFHPLVQFLLMGLNGAFLTGDLFNLFVFFELTLAASYGLLLHGSGAPRVREALHYIVINLSASLLFLIGVSLIYGVTGTLNMADLAQRIPAVAAGDRGLLQAGAALLGTAFLVKAGMWPLGIWLPGVYAAATPPVSALFAILSKLGVYVVLRLWLLLFAAQAGAAAPFGADWLWYGGMATLAFGIIGVLAAQDLGRLAGASVLVSTGTLLATIATGNAAATGSALYYLVSSTLAISAFFLLIALVERGRSAAAGLLAVTMEAFAVAGEEDDEVEAEAEPGYAIPATVAILGISFFCCGLLLAGLPPLSGFVAKFALLSAVLNPAGAAAVPANAAAVPANGWALLALLIVSGIAAIIAVSRAGIRNFWAPAERTVPRVRVIEMAPIALLLFLCAALTVEAGPVMRYMQATAQSLHAPRAGYLDAVLQARPAPRPAAAQGRTDGGGA